METVGNADASRRNRAGCPRSARHKGSLCGHINRPPPLKTTPGSLGRPHRTATAQSRRRGATSLEPNPVPETEHQHVGNV